MKKQFVHINEKLFINISHISFVKFEMRTGYDGYGPHMFINVSDPRFKVDHESPVVIEDKQKILELCSDLDIKCPWNI